MSLEQDCKGAQPELYRDAARYQWVRQNLETLVKEWCESLTGHRTEQTLVFRGQPLTPAIVDKLVDLERP